EPRRGAATRGAAFQALHQESHRMTTTAASETSDIKDPRLAAEGRRRTEWAERSMPVLRLIRERFSRERPLVGRRLSACLHVTTETANLAVTLQAGGADVALCASNPLSTQDDVAAHLVKDHGIKVFAIKGEDHATYYEHIRAALAHRPDITMDDGADLVGALHMIALNRLDDLAPPVRRWVEPLSGAGGNVIVTEIDPLKALEAQMDGYRVMPMAEAAAIGDVFVTLTGNTHVLRVEHMRAMKDGAVLANSGHFNVEIDLEGLKQVAQGPTRVREFVDEWRLGGKRVFVLADGQPPGAGRGAGAADLARPRRGQRHRHGARRREVRAAAHPRSPEAGDPRPGRRPAESHHHPGEGQYVLRRAAHLPRRRGDP